MIHPAFRLCILAAITVLAARADQVPIPAMKDNTLYEDPNGLISNGAGQHMFAGSASGSTATIKRRALVAFGVAAHVPSGSTIQSVTLTLHMSRVPMGAQPEMVALHRVLSDWGEGTSNAPLEEGLGAPATPNDATWIHTFYDNRFWTLAAGDFVAAHSAAELVDPLGFYEFASTPETVADVRAWLDDPTQDFGWILIGNEAALRTVKRFDTREHPESARRPLLTVEFIPPPACPGDLNGDGFTDLADLGILLADFGCTPPGPCVGDLDGDGDTDLADLGILLADFGCAP